MAVPTYILRMRDGTATIDIPLNSNGRVEIYDGATPHEIVNVPDSPPPVGQFPVWDGPQMYLVPFTELVDRTYEGIANSIRTKFNEQIEQVEPLTTQYDNAPSVANYPNVYGHLSVEFDDAQQVEIGSPRGFVVFGNAVASLRAPLEAGDGELLALADRIEVLFRGLTEREVIYGAPTLSHRGADDAWWLVDVVIPFRVNRTEVPLINGPYGVGSLTAAANATRARFEDTVVATLGVPVQYDNAPPITRGFERWISHRIEQEQSYAAEIISGGLGTFTHPGNMIAELYAPAEAGDAVLLQMADVIDSNFRSVSDGGVVYGTPYVERLGRTRDDMWWQVRITCPFSFDVAA